MVHWGHKCKHDRTSVSPDYPLSLVRDGGEMPKHCIEEKVYALEDLSGDSAALQVRWGSK